MNMSRRAFLMQPLRAIRADMENAGHWLRRASVRTAPAPLAKGGVEATNGRDSAGAARGIGLRETRERMRRDEHEQL
jgi:hypothetical protein